MIFNVTLRYEGKDYTYQDEIEIFDQARYLYIEGNYACDCNRSLFLARYCGVDFGNNEEGLACGNEIELISLTPVKEQHATFSADTTK